MVFSIKTTLFLVLNLAVLTLIGYLLFLLIKALRKYLRSETSRKEKSESPKSLGDVLKKHRSACRMTQEYVAETVGVSRQAVSKWESGLTDPSTSNLMALAKLFGVTPEELLKETQQKN